MKPYLFINPDGKLHCCFISERTSIEWYDEQKKNEAIEDALQVINPEVFVNFFNRGLGTFKKNELITWSGSATVEEIKSDFNLIDGWEYQKVIRLSTTI